MIVPPSAMIPLMLSRSRMTWLPGGRSPSNPSRKPTTSQPSFSAARTTPRRTALSPGQSPPLVRTPIRGFIFAISSNDGLWSAVPRGRNTNPYLHLRKRSIKASSLNRQDGRQLPIDRIVASHVAKALCLHQIDSCSPRAQPSKDAGTRSPFDPAEQLRPDDWHTESNNHPTAQCDPS